MSKILGFACLAVLVGALGCSTASTGPEQPPAVDPATTPDEAASGDATTLRDAQPKGERLVQANPKLATLRAKFVYGGKAPDRAKLDVTKDPFCAQHEVLSEALLVGANGELQNLALILDARRSKAEIPADQLKAPEAKIELDNKNCVFVPHVVFARPGQTIVAKNSDPVGHNANFNFFNNTPMNILLPAGGSKDVPLSADEPAPIPVECNIHPWMRSYLIVQEHPYVGISGKDGVIEIANLPLGEVTFRIWHESADGAIDEGKVGGKTEKWSRGRMELELKAGINDLGTITIDPSKFKS